MDCQLCSCRIHSGWAAGWMWGRSASSTTLASPTTLQSTSTFLPISLASMSNWMMVASWAKVPGSSATRSENRVPTAISTSALLAALLVV